MKSYRAAKVYKKLKASRARLERLRAVSRHGTKGHIRTAISALDKAIAVYEEAMKADDLHRRGVEVGDSSLRSE